MANRNLDTAWTFGKRIIEVTGSFGPNGGSNPLSSSFKGKGWRDKTGGVVRTGTGTFVVTFDDPFLDINGLSVDLQVPSAQGNWAQPGPITNVGATSAPTVTIFTVNSSGTAVDISAAANTAVFFTVTFRDSTVGFSKP
jgi:hypothetical protein